MRLKLLHSASTVVSKGQAEVRYVPGDKVKSDGTLVQKGTTNTIAVPFCTSRIISGLRAICAQMVDWDLRYGQGIRGYKVPSRTNVPSNKAQSINTYQQHAQVDVETTFCVQFCHSCQF